MESARRRTRAQRGGLWVGAVLTALVLALVWFTPLRPTQALRGTFQNSWAARVLHFTQGNDAWVSSTTYSAVVVAQGQALELQPDLHLSPSPAEVERVLRDWHACGELLSHPRTDLRHYDNTDPRSPGVMGLGTREIYLIQHVASHTHCLVYAEE